MITIIGEREEFSQILLISKQERNELWIVLLPYGGDWCLQDFC